MSMAEKNAFGIEKSLASLGTAADVGTLGRKAKKMPDPLKAKTLNSVKRAKADMPFSHKVVANAAQHPVGTGVATTASTVTPTAASIYGNQKVKKDMTGPFGVEISKAIHLPMTHKGAVNANQVANQMRKVGEQKGSKTIQLRHAKRVAGEKFQNK